MLVDYLSLLFQSATRGVAASRVVKLHQIIIAVDP